MDTEASISTIFRHIFCEINACKTVKLRLTATNAIFILPSLTLTFHFAITRCLIDKTISISLLCYQCFSHKFCFLKLFRLINFVDPPFGQTIHSKWSIDRIFQGTILSADEFSNFNFFKRTIRNL